MAIYHLEAKVISRGAGRSAVAASAYMSCSEILNDYDGVQHDYTRKQGLVWEQIFLPDNAPEEWADRSTLWNAVESAEKAKDSRLAREFVVALPIELKSEQWRELLTDYIQSNFVSKGICADVCIHDTDGHNPHAHIMLTVRPLNENGTWQYKTEKEYLCVKNGEERGLTATEFKPLKNEGWEKQYPYKVGKKKVYMSTSEADKQSYERVNKYPKSTKYGRQNPLTEQWNSEEQLLLWRKNWADTSNLYLKKAHSSERIDHRSHNERGIEEQPTVHEGVFSKMIEERGVLSDRAKLNTQIKADNALLKTLKKEVQRLLNVIKTTIPVLAEAMEAIRRNILVYCYQQNHIRNGKSKYMDYLKPIKQGLTRYIQLNGEIKKKTTERKIIQSKKKATSIVNLPKQHSLSRQIAELTENLEELHTEKNMLLRRLNCGDSKAIGNVRKEISEVENTLKILNQQEMKYTNEVSTALEKFAELELQSTEVDIAELKEKRLEIRTDKEKMAVEHIKTTYGKHFSYDIFNDSKQDVAKLFGEEIEKRSVIDRLARNRQVIAEKSGQKVKYKEQER